MTVYRYTMLMGALNGRTYQFDHDRGPVFTLPASDQEYSAYAEALKKWKDAQASGVVYPRPAPPKDITYQALTVTIEQDQAADVNDPRRMIETRFCVPEEMGTDPEIVSKHMIRYFSRLNTAAADAVHNAPMISPEIVRLGKFIGVFHR